MSHSNVGRGIFVGCVLFCVAFDLGFTGMFIGFIRRGSAPTLVPCTVHKTIYIPQTQSCYFWVGPSDKVFVCTNVVLFGTNDQWGEHCLNPPTKPPGELDEECASLVMTKTGKCWQRWDGTLWLTLSDLYFSVLDMVIAVAFSGSCVFFSGTFYLYLHCRSTQPPPHPAPLSTPLLLAMPVDSDEAEEAPLATIVSVQ